VARERKRERGSDEALHPSVPASVAHTGEVDEFDAALVRGAAGAGPIGAEDDANGEPGRGLAERVERAATPAPRAAHTGNRLAAFLRASWAELQRVQWPDREQVGQATAVVLGFVVVAGLYLGGADWVAQKVVNAIL
jgi:preprotein translocase SecE subunit